MKWVYLRKYVTVFAVILPLLWTLPAAAQCVWGISVQGTNSSCAANGSISVSLTGADKANVTGILYSLNAISGSSYNVAPTPSASFSNVPPGTYLVTAQGICGGATVSQQQSVTIVSDYQQLSASIIQDRASLYNCNSGIGAVHISQGRLPYTVKITSAPTNYTFSTLFSTRDSVFQLNNLATGNYTVSVTDSCGAISNTLSLTISELPPISGASFNGNIFPQVVSGCDKVLIPPPAFNGNLNYQDYYDVDSFLVYSISVGGRPKTPYRTFTIGDTLTLPAGQSIKDLYGDTVRYYVKTKCQPEFSFAAEPINEAFLGYAVARNCDSNFNVNFYTGNPIICLPVIAQLTNLNTQQVFSAALNGTDFSIRNLPFGTYRLHAVTNDGYVLDSTSIITDTLSADPPYRIFISSSEGQYGDAGVANVIVAAGTRSLQTGNTLQIISPFTSQPYTVSYSANWLILNPDGTPVDCTPGNYIARITDDCGVTDIPFTVLEQDVYRYHWTLDTVRVCAGLQVTPHGTYTYQGDTEPAIFKILNPQSGVYADTIHSGTSVILPFTDIYRIATGAFYDARDFDIKNVSELYFDNPPLAIDVNRTGGYVCPGNADSLGKIQVNGLGGFTSNGAHYTYRLAMAGQGNTGPYLDVNTTGIFSTATAGGRYKVMKDQEYDVRIEDSCGASRIQTLRIIDFATAQLATSDKPEYCIGDTVRLSVLNLPSTANPNSYTWTFPNGRVWRGQYPWISSITEATAGLYRVSINSDACQQAINATVVVKLAPFVKSCYSAVTDTSVNPYTYGMLGNWRQSTSYVYYGARSSTNPTDQTDIRHDGTYADFTDFLSFWKDQQDGTTDTTKWVWNQQSTVFNKFGFELENKDPLGRYNSGLYGYDDALPVAVTQNSRYREAGFDGFEDYGFGQDSCETACATARPFDFSLFKDKIDSTQQHTGRYSIRVQTGDSTGISAQVTNDLSDVSPAFNFGVNACNGQVALESVRTSANILLPVFSPIPGKQVLVSAWVKEAQDCQCTSYSHNQIHISVSRTGGGEAVLVIAKPSGAIIDGWQRYEQVVDVPADAKDFRIVLQALDNTTAYFDDIRVHPFNANMKSFVYDPVNLRMMAELDENNYATFYEYDDDGTLIRVKKETERGVKTITETRSALIKQ